jgi:hypothetical protein
MFVRVALLCLLACGTRTTTVEPPIAKDGSAQARPAARKPVAIAIVFEGWEMWVGNDQLDVPEHERYAGALKPFKEALSRLDVSDFPAGSQAAVVTYGEGAKTRHAMQPVDKLVPEAFGEQKDYADTIDRDLAGGVKLGLDELAKVDGARRVLVVIGDGNDTNHDAAKGALAELATRAAKENVEIVSLVYQAPLSPPSRTIVFLDPGAVSVHSVDGIVDQLGFLFVRLKQRPSAPVGGKHAVALALVASGAETWMGNDDIVPPNDPGRYVGALKAIRAAFESTPTYGFPRGSVGMFATYDSSARIRVPMLPIDKLDLHAIGTQKDYYGAIGDELVGGVTLAFTELVKVQAGRRVLIVIGDGADTNNEAAKTQLQGLAKRAAEFHIEVHAIVYKSQLSVPETVVTVLDPNATVATTADEITAQLGALFSRVRSQ